MGKSGKLISCKICGTSPCEDSKGNIFCINGNCFQFNRWYSAKDWNLLNEPAVEEKKALKRVLERLMSTANLTSGAVAESSGMGHAVLRTYGVVKKSNILYCFENYGSIDVSQYKEKDDK